MSSTPDVIVLTVPAETEYLHLLRLNAAALAGSTGLDIDEIEDLKIAVEELGAWLVAIPGLGGQLTARFGVFGGFLSIRGERTGVSIGETIDDFLVTILDAVVDHHELVSTETSVGFGIQKRIRER